MKVELDLTPDEWTILAYVIDGLEYQGEPLKDTYELGDEEPADPDAVLKTMTEKVLKAAFTAKQEVKKSLICGRNYAEGAFCAKQKDHKSVCSQFENGRPKS